ncbi:MAG: low-specificity L-threonine aldolase [Anaerolineales bacterium]|nr:low-specificity L-threonine aldolase [Anaerolineales bacterium]MBS3752496.1 low-specificity L-threonine aldolase [Anaerolineales bacterium]
MMQMIDLRSDTVTKPTPEMREAMASAQVGDDVYGEDPTINRLEAYAAELLGKEAALFVPSGTMGNLAAVLTHCRRGDEIILGDSAHTFLFEVGGVSALGGVQTHPVPNQADGTLRLEDIKNAIRPQNIHYPTTRLITLENTHNRCGGVPLTLDYMEKVGAFAQEQGLQVHLDGARIFNAAEALDVDVRQLVEPVDSVMFCLSKGLAAPVGSLLCGREGFINRARKTRKQLGGGMRQAGILAAAGLVALQKMRLRLAEDHARAKRLAEGLRRVSGLDMEPTPPPTNMVYCSLEEGIPYAGEEIAGFLEKEGVLVGVTAKRRFRLVTHYWIRDPDVKNVVQAFRKVLSF